MSSARWSVAQDLDFYRRRGIHTAGIMYFKLLPDVRASIAAIKAAGLRASCVAAGKAMGASLVARSEGVDNPALDVLAGGIDAAAELGATNVYFTAGSTPRRMPTDEAYDRLVENLAAPVAYARSKGIRLVIEPNATATRPNGFIHSLPDALDLARDADLDIDLELQNCWTERHLDRIIKENIERFAVVQVSDFTVGEDAHLNRRVPGDGWIPLEWLLGRILDAGYGGLFELEVLGPHIEEEGYESSIDRGLAWLSERLTTWGA